MEGTVTAVDLKASPPTMQVTSSSGGVLTLLTDPATTSIVKGGHLGTWEDVAVHNEIKAKLILKDGKYLLESIEIKEPPTSDERRVPAP